MQQAAVVGQLRSTSSAMSRRLRTSSRERGRPGRSENPSDRTMSMRRRFGSVTANRVTARRGGPLRRRGFAADRCRSEASRRQGRVGVHRRRAARRMDLGAGGVLRAGVAAVSHVSDHLASGHRPPDTATLIGGRSSRRCRCRRRARSSGPEASVAGGDAAVDDGVPARRRRPSCRRPCAAALPTGESHESMNDDRPGAMGQMNPDVDCGLAPGGGPALALGLGGGGCGGGLLLL